MKVIIELKTESDDNFSLESDTNKKFVNININNLSVKVDVDELKKALRKIQRD